MLDINKELEKFNRLLEDIDDDSESAQTPRAKENVDEGSAEESKGTVQPVSAP